MKFARHSDRMNLEGVSGVTIGHMRDRTKNEYYAKNGEIGALYAEQDRSQFHNRSLV